MIIWRRGFRGKKNASANAQSLEFVWKVQGRARSQTERLGWRLHETRWKWSQKSDRGYLTWGLVRIEWAGEPVKGFECRINKIWLSFEMNHCGHCDEDWLKRTSMEGGDQVVYCKIPAETWLFAEDIREVGEKACMTLWKSAGKALYRFCVLWAFK